MPIRIKASEVGTSPCGCEDDSATVNDVVVAVAALQLTVDTLFKWLRQLVLFACATLLLASLLTLALP